MPENAQIKSVPMIVNVAKWTQTDFRKKARSSNKLQMISISYSHYCEFARFALLVDKVEFEELKCAPGQHILPTLALRYGGETPAISESAAMYKVGKEGEAKAKAEKAARSTATPVAVAPDGSVYVDSWDIAKSTGLARCDEGLRKLLDEGVGIDARHAAYFYLLQDRNIPLFHEMGGINDSWEWRTIWNFGLKHHVTKLLGGTFLVSDAAAKDVALARLRDTFRRIDDEHLRGKKGDYLSGGDAPGLGDVALAALAAPIVLPGRNYGGKYRGVFDRLLEGEAELRGIVEEFRATAVGRHCLMVYERHRPLAEGVAA
uniref:GST C-terminal domain-containing protein n=1 Tax=Hemiselmis tepida TaxID=464990 RepID=A0A7S0VQZ4_9CRYP|mmetsp:Transcript_24771/g.62784  ORF Transcript_24771/g.62784 Transcript_24771/m.62784 type:complete len:317 (+) Transcript_24771:70-1020(+)